MVIINNGYKGQVMDIYNKNEGDRNTLYSELMRARPRTIKLVTIEENKYIRIKRSDCNYNKIVDKLKTLDGLLVKKFLYLNVLFGTRERNFNNELNGYKNLIRIFGKNVDKYTTIKEGFIYNNKKIYGIIFNENYYVFLERCFKTLEEINFTQETFRKCENEIIETLDILNANNYIHNDLKPNNIIYCRNRFKIIDWEGSTVIDKSGKALSDGNNGNLVHNHPLKYYNLGILLMIYNYIYEYELFVYEYLRGLKRHKEIHKKVNESFSKVLDKYKSLMTIEPLKEPKKPKKTMKYNEIREDKLYYKKLYDYYSYALTMIYLAEKNNLNYNKKLINPILEKFFVKL